MNKFNYIFWIVLSGVYFSAVAMQQHSKELSVCSVCQEPVLVTDGSKVCGSQLFETPPCVEHHAHHDECMAQMLDAYKYETRCPYCRAVLKKDVPAADLAPLSRAALARVFAQQREIHRAPVPPTADDLLAMEIATGFATPPPLPTPVIDLSPAFFAAVGSGNLEQTHQLITQGVDVNAVQPGTGKTALIMAAEAGNAAMVRLLIVEGHANCDVPDAQGITALTYAAYHGHIAVMQSLFADGHENPLHAFDGLARAYRHEPIAHGSEWSAWTHEDDVLFAASRDGIAPVVSYIMRHGMMTSLVDADGCTPLMYAARNGHLAVVTILVEKGQDVLVWNHAGQTARDLAMAQGHREVADFLAQHEPHEPVTDASPVAYLFYAARTKNMSLMQKVIAAHPLLINMRDERGRTALMYAADLGDAPMTRFLIKHGAELDAHDYTWCSCALSLAVLSKHLDVVRVLVEEGDASLTVQDADGDDESIVNFARGVDQEIETYVSTQLQQRGGPERKRVHRNIGQELRSAAQEGDVATVVRLAREYPEVINEQDDLGYTPLLCAVSYGRLQVVRRLVTGFHADMNVKDEHGKIARDHVVEYHNPEILAFLDHPYMPDLFAAVRSGDCECVHQALVQGADIDAIQPESGKTVLIMAAEAGNVPLVHLLITEGHANCDIRDAYGYTALMYATRNGHTEVVQTLFVDGHLHTDQNLDALALAYRCVPIIRLFEEHGYGSVRYEHRSNSIFFAAVREGIEPVIRHLVDDKMAPGWTIVDEFGFTPLMYAAQNGCLPMVQLMVEKGADVLLRNNAGLTARDLAHAQHHTEVADFLAHHEPKKPDASAGPIAQLLFAARTRNISVVRHVINKHPLFINMRDSQGQTPLMCAVIAGDEAMARFLIERGANIEAYDYEKFSSALVSAINFRKLALVRILVEEGHASFDHAMDNDGDFIRVDKYAKELGYDEIAQYLAEQRMIRRRDGALQPSVRSDVGKQLREAAEKGDLATVTQIVRTSPDVINEPGDDGDTAFLNAIGKNAFDIVQFLAPYVDVNYKNRYETALSMAVYYDHPRIVRYLVDTMHADVTMRDGAGKTVLDSARERNQHVIVAILNHAYPSNELPTPAEIAEFDRAQEEWDSEKCLKLIDRYPSLVQRNERVTSIMIGFDQARELQGLQADQADESRALLEHKKRCCTIL